MRYDTDYKGIISHNFIYFYILLLYRLNKLIKVVIGEIYGRYYV